MASWSRPKVGIERADDAAVAGRCRPGARRIRGSTEPCTFARIASEVYAGFTSCSELRRRDAVARPVGAAAGAAAGSRAKTRTGARADARAAPGARSPAAARSLRRRRRPGGASIAPGSDSTRRAERHRRNVQLCDELGLLLGRLRRRRRRLLDGTVILSLPGSSAIRGGSFILLPPPPPPPPGPGSLSQTMCSFGSSGRNALTTVRGREQRRQEERGREKKRVDPERHAPSTSGFDSAASRT